MIEIKLNSHIEYYYTEAKSKDRFDILRVDTKGELCQEFTNSPDTDILECGEIISPSYLSRNDYDSKIFELLNVGYECDLSDDLIDEPLPKFWDSFYTDSKSEYLNDVIEVDMKSKEYALWERQDLEEDELDEMTYISRSLFDLILSEIKKKGFKRV